MTPTSQGANNFLSVVGLEATREDSVHFWEERPSIDHLVVILLTHISGTSSAWRVGCPVRA